MTYLLDYSLSKIILLQVKKFYGYYLIAFLALMGTHIAQSKIPLLAKNLGDLAITQNLDKAPIGQCILIALIVFVFRTSSRILFFYPARVLQKKMRIEIIDRFLVSRPSHYNSINKGDLFQIIQTDIDQLRAYIGFALLQVANAIICLSILIPQLYNFSSHLFVSILPLFCAMVIFSYLSIKMSPYFKKTADLSAKLQNTLIEAHASKLTIKSFLAHESIFEVFSKQSEEETKSFVKAGVKSSFFAPLMGLGVGLSLIAGAYNIFQYHLTPSSFIYFSGIVFLIFEPLSFFSWIGPIYSQARAAMTRIHQTVQLLQTKKEEEKQINFKEDENFYFLPVHLWNISPDPIFEINKNKITMIIGDTGVGKSTFLEELCYIFKAQHKNVFFMPQLPHLFNDTVGNNIFLDTVDTKIENYGKELLDIFGLQQLEFSMEVGENGKKLSGGQQKRLAIIRTLINIKKQQLLHSNSDKILIWDDPMDSLDIIQEKNIFEYFLKEKVLEGVTVIISTHRYTTFSFGDILLNQWKDLLPFL